MSCFHKLQLQGVRSFGPSEDEAGLICFLNPLTLILGDNGCGKTTIIEALKFATCGELPSSTKGGNSFVHDPKLTMASEVRGQVRLGIRDTIGKKMSVTRTVSCTQKVKTTTFKTLDQTVSYQKDDGSWQNMSHKCGDIDSLMTQSLGVSKAILSNVLLCHQEDSNWPLEEDSKVKTKFDEIFGATKYNKALDQVRIVSKSLSQDAKLLKNESEHLNKYKEIASEKRVQLSQAEVRRFEYEQNLEVFDTKLKPIHEKLTELAKKENDLSTLKTKLETQKSELKSVQNIIDEYKANIKQEFHGSIDELKDTISNFQVQINQKQAKFDQLEQQGEELNAKLKKIQQLVNDEQYKVGQLERDNAKNRERIDDRNRAMLALSEELGINTSVSSLSQKDEIQRVFDQIQEAIYEHEEEINNLKEEQKQQVNELQKEIDKHREDKAKSEQNHKNLKKQMEQNNKELKKVKSEIYEVDNSTQALDQLQKDLKVVTTELENLDKNHNIKDMEKQIIEATNSKDNLEGELNELDKEVERLQSFSKLQTELDFKTDAKNKKDNEIKRLKNMHENSLLTLLGEIPESGIKFQLDALKDRLGDEIKSKSEEIKMKDNEATALESEYRHIAEKLRNSRQKLEADEYAINQACSGNSYDKFLATLASKLEDLRDQKGTLSSSEFLFKKYVNKLQEKEPCCPLCKRGFSEKEELDQLQTELSFKVRELPEKIRKNLKELEKYQTEYNNLLQLKPKYDKLSSLKSVEIPDLESQLKKVEKKVQQNKQIIESLKADLEDPVSKEEIAKRIHSDIVILEQNIVDRRKLIKDIQKLADQMPSGPRKTLDDALNEQKEKKQALKNARKLYESLQNERYTLNVKRNKLQEDKNSIQDKQLKISGNGQRRGQLEEKKDELELLEVTVQAELDKEIQSISRGARELENLSRKMSLLVSEHAKKIEERNLMYKQLDLRLSELRTKQQAITEYEASGGDRKLKAAQEDLESLQKQNDNASLEKDLCFNERDKIKDEISSQKVRQRELDDTLKMRIKELDAQELVKNIRELQKLVGNINFDELYKEKNELKRQEARLYNDKSSAEGSKREVERTIEGINKELEQDQLKNADKNYNDNILKMEILDISLKDLNIYHKALESTMYHYHKVRIAHINSIIKSLWRKIYSGNDIDHIEIKAEQTNTASKIESEKKRAYTYRVVQIKNGTEIDMRGRCSAGQKVLACLIIRIALAETFSSNCGVLALDEPTTNLDHNNIINLSTALEEIVKTQSARKNFQLIVITHDQEFLNILKRGEKIDYYYKLERRPTGASKVLKINMH